MKRILFSWWLLLCVALTFSVTARATSRSTLTAWLYQTALEMPRSRAPGETDDAAEERLERIARADAEVAAPYATGKAWTASELSMAVLVLVNEETRFDERIHDGKPHPKWNEDHGLAKCLGQVHVSRLVPAADWARLAGKDYESTKLCLAATTLVWVRVAAECGVWYGRRASRADVAKVFMAYGSGGKCTPDERAWSRADKWLARMAKRPDRSPLPGYRRALPSEFADSVTTVASSLRDTIHGHEDVGVTKEAVLADRRWAFRVEEHADGKVGVSVFVEDR